MIVLKGTLSSFAEIQTILRQRGFIVDDVRVHDHIVLIQVRKPPEKNINLKL